MDAGSAQSVIDEVLAIKGFDPLRIHDENTDLALFYLPSLISAYRALIAKETEKIDLLKVKIKEVQRRERLRLLELRAKGEGPGGTKLDVDTIKFFSTRGTETLDYETMIAQSNARVSALWGYATALEKANATALSYSGRKREESKFVFGQHKLSHNFEKPSHSTPHLPINPYETRDPYQPPSPPSEDTYELPDIEEEE